MLVPVHQKSIKIRSKIIEKSSKKFAKIFQNPSKINQKSMKISSWAPRCPKTQDPPKPKNRSTFATPPDPLWEAFLGHVGPKSHQKAIQNTYKILIDLEVHLASIFHRCWQVFGSILEPSWLPKSIKNWIKMLTNFLLEF